MAGACARLDELEKALPLGQAALVAALADALAGDRLLEVGDECWGLRREGAW